VCYDGDCRTRCQRNSNGQPLSNTFVSSSKQIPSFLLVCASQHFSLDEQETNGAAKEQKDALLQTVRSDNQYLITDEMKIRWFVSKQKRVMHAASSPPPWRARFDILAKPDELIIKQM